MGKDFHVVMVPWLAFGHMIPFLELSIALAKAGVRVSYISTPKNTQRLPNPPPSLQHLINFVHLPLPPVENLPEGAEATVDLPFEKIQYLKIAYDLLHTDVNQFISDNLPDCIIVDFSPHWIGSIARENKVPVIFFSVFCSVLWSFVGPVEHLTNQWPTPESLTSPPDWLPSESTVVFRGYEAEGFHSGAFGMNASGITDAGRLAAVVDACQAVAPRGSMEFDGEYIELLGKLYNKPMIPVGILPRDQQEEIPIPRKIVFEWLDSQKPNSVVFVGFGSEYKLTREEVYEIAHGLELSQLPFLWALRKPIWAADDSDALPAGLEERTSGRGIVSPGWAPQMKILAHPSVGASLFHSGWGSIIESLQHGHSLVLLPFILDQGLNARFLVDKGLGVEVERRADGSFSRNEVAKALTLAMGEEEGERIKARAQEASAIFGNGELQGSYMDRFVEYLKKGAKDQ